MLTVAVVVVIIVIAAAAAAAAVPRQQMSCTVFTLVLDCALVQPVIAGSLDSQGSCRSPPKATRTCERVRSTHQRKQMQREVKLVSAGQSFTADSTS